MDNQKLNKAIDHKLKTKLDQIQELEITIHQQNQEIQLLELIFQQIKTNKLEVKDSDFQSLSGFSCNRSLSKNVMNRSLSRSNINRTKTNLSALFSNRKPKSKEETCFRKNNNMLQKRDEDQLVQILQNKGNQFLLEVAKILFCLRYNKVCLRNEFYRLNTPFYKQMNFKEQADRMSARMKEHVRFKIEELNINLANDEVQNYNCLISLVEMLDTHIVKENVL